jgi:hypothetical protein
MKILLLIGNGFNHLLLNIIKNYPLYRLPRNIKTNQDKIVEVLGQIIYLYYELPLEELKRTVKASDWEESLSGFNNYCEFIDKHKLHGDPKPLGMFMKHKMDELVKSSMRNVASKSNLAERQGAYKDIKRVFPSFGLDFKKLIDCNGVTDLSIFTTNYDGILDTLLTDQSGNFLFRDSFGFSGTQGVLKFNPYYLNKNRLSIAHLHGSYKFYEVNGETFKLKGTIFNENPIMVLSSPELKENVLIGNNVLSAYYDRFKNNLREYDRIVIFGNSLNSEPHLKKAIKENFNRIGTELVICSNSPDKVEQQLKGYYDQFIYKFGTNDVMRERDLLNLFYQLFNEDIVNCSRCLNNFVIAA